MNHISVLKNELISNLNIIKNGIYVDCTLGAGGHTKEIVKNLDKNGHIYSFDQDINACLLSKKKLCKFSDQITIINDNFSNIDKKLNEKKISKVDGIIYDLGVSSMQLDTQSRGFSYKFDSFLDMRMNQNLKKTAFDIVNTYSLQELTDIFFKYGEEKYSYKISQNIINFRNIKLINTTEELVNIIKKSIPKKYQIKKHPARKVFQALRIEVNDELNNLKKSLEKSFSILKPKGRLAVISFHSLEDRIVKKFFNNYSKIQGPNNYLEKLTINEERIKGKLITKKPILPTKDEIKANSRSRSAKLRILEKIED